MSETILKINNLTERYKKHTVIDHMSFEIK